MSLNLYFLRHGIAVERGTPGFARDADRPLTSKGKRQLHKITRAMRAMKLRFDLILSSPLVRARQTAEIVAADLKLKKRLTFADELQPGGDAKALVKRIATLGPKPENLVLVGHEPDLSKLISLFVTGQPDAGFALKKGGLAKLEIEQLRVGQCANLAWLLTPGQMKLMP
jgi:phosphohistidine phosphatase